MPVSCPACSLPNPEGSARCRRCATPLIQESETAWRDGPQLILKQGGVLPARCVRCNAPTGGAGFKRTYYWHHPALYIVALLALLIYVLIAIAVRKKALVFVGLCSEHAKQRRWAHIGSPILVILGVVLLLVAIEAGAVFGWTGLAMIVAGAIWGTIGSRALTAVRIDDQFARFRGACAPYLDQLTPWASFS